MIDWITEQWQRFTDWLDGLFGGEEEEVPPDVPGTQPPPPTTTTPPPVAPPIGGTTPSTLPITRTTPFRQCGSLPSARVCDILGRYPLGVECKGIAAAADPLNALPIAQSYMESSYGQAANAKAAKNPLGLLASDGQTLLQFASNAEAFAEWKRRMTDPSYKGGVYQPAGMSLEQFVYTYVGGPGCWSTKGAACANGETKASVERYLSETIARLNRYWGVASAPPPLPAGSGYRGWNVAGSSAQLMLPNGLPFRQQLTPVGPNRSQRALRWTGTTQHTTNNVNRGAGAAMHATWQAKGTPGHPDGKIGVHFYVDDKEVVQCLPINEQGVHSGDWRNQEHTAVELCVNSDRDPNRAEANAVALQAGLLHILGKTGTQAMYPHTDGGHCPRLTVAWSEWERRVDAGCATLAQIDT